MSTGFYQQGICYAQLQDAIDAHFQSQPNYILSTGFTTVFILPFKDAHNVWSYQKTTVSDVGTSTNQFTIPLNNPTFSSCQTVDFSQYDINPANVLYVLTWGLSYLLIMWSLGYAIGVAKRAIDKV